MNETDAFCILVEINSSGPRVEGHVVIIISLSQYLLSVFFCSSPVLDIYRLKNKTNQ